MFVATEDPFDTKMIAVIEEVVNISVSAGFAIRSDLVYALNRIYNNLVRANKNIRDFYDGFAYLLEKPELDADRVINLLLALGYLLSASDIHLTFSREDFFLGVRIDGSLHSVPLSVRRLNSDQISQLRNALMIKGGIGMSRCNQPQTGSLELMIDKTSVKARLATFPLYNGEKAVLRFIGRIQRRSLDNLGLRKADQNQIRKILTEPSGLIMVAAPAGNGKSTTLYSFLSSIPYQSKNIFAIEDSIEANLPHVSQTLVSRDGPNTYETALENIGPQDTDVILVGSVESDRAIELTVDLAVADNLVLTSLPMENVVQVILHLIRSGVDPLLVAATLKLVISQRLAPLISTECKAPHPRAKAMTAKINLSPETNLYHGTGCQRCYFKP